MDTPLVSVIIPVYNVENYVKECINSVINQTYKNIEIILIDDGSTDKSGAICDEYLYDDRVSVIHKENGGLSDARNVGIDVCHGEILAFLDSDDYVSPIFIEEMIMPIVSGKCDMTLLKASTPFYDENPVKLNNDLKLCTEEIVNSKIALEMMLYQKVATGAPFKVCKRSAFKTIRFPVGYYYEDVATTYKIFFESNTVGIIDSDLYAYRERSTSITHQNFNSKKIVALNVHDQLLNDKNIIDSGLVDASTARVFQMIFNVFLQVPKDNKDIMIQFWDKIVKDRRCIIGNKSRLLNKKNKYGAVISYLGMNITHRLCNVLLHH